MRLKTTRIQYFWYEKKTNKIKVKTTNLHIFNQSIFENTAWKLYSSGSRWCHQFRVCFNYSFWSLIIAIIIFFKSSFYYLSLFRPAFIESQIVIFFIRIIYINQSFGKTFGWFRNYGPIYTMYWISKEKYLKENYYLECICRLLNRKIFLSVYICVFRNDLYDLCSSQYEMSHNSIT